MKFVNFNFNLKILLEMGEFKFDPLFQEYSFAPYEWFRDTFKEDTYDEPDMQTLIIRLSNEL